MSWVHRKGQEQGTGNREQGTGNREQGAGKRETEKQVSGMRYRDQGEMAGDRDWGEFSKGERGVARGLGCCGGRETPTTAGGDTGATDVGNAAVLAVLA